MPDDDFARSHRLRINIAHRIRKYPFRNVIENPWFENVDSGEHQGRSWIVDRGSWIGGYRKARKFRDAGILCDLHFAEPFAFVVREKD